MAGCETDRQPTSMAFEPSRVGSPRHRANRGAGEGETLMPVLVEGEVLTSPRRHSCGPDVALHVLHKLDGGQNGRELSGRWPRNV